MAQVACRWPGGTTLVLNRTGASPLLLALNGPGTAIQALANTGGLRGAMPTSRSWVGGQQDAMRAALAQLQATADNPTATDYVVNDVPDSYWNAWLDQNQDDGVTPHIYDLVRYAIVFEAPDPALATE